MRRLFLLSSLLLPSLAAAQLCTGDCDGSGGVTVDEIVIALNIGLGSRPITGCPAADSGDDGAVTVDEIVAAVNFALNGCPAVTPTPTATSTPSPADDVLHLDVGSGDGVPGAVVRVPVTLSQNDGSAVAVSVDITYETQFIRAVTNDNVPCMINPEIGPGTAADKMLFATFLPGGGSSETLRLGVIGFANPSPIPNGVVVTCDFRIMPAAPPGEVVLENLPDASDAVGNVIPVIGSNGVVTIVVED